MVQCPTCITIYDSESQNDALKKNKAGRLKIKVFRDKIELWSVPCTKFSPQGRTSPHIADCKRPPWWWDPLV